MAERRMQDQDSN